MKPVIHIKRAYDTSSHEDGYRVLVDRIWPRGLTKEALNIDDWAKVLAPTTELRKWFNHDPALWAVFQQRYKQELKHNEEVVSFIEKYEDKKLITLVYAAKDTEHNHALVLQQYLQQH
jgi:uncharacterized protein YeaO (DUF488 family)